MDFAISAAKWVLGKALAPVMDGMLEAWAASKNLGLNMGELKMELLYAQGMLDHAQGREIHSPALKELLLKLQQLAYDSDDMLDELDYFRIQDELYGTFEAADKDDRGVIQDTTLHGKAVFDEQGRILRGQDSRPDAIPDDSPDQQQQGEARQRQRAEPAGRVRRLAYNACQTIGKHLLCCTCPPPVQADSDSGTMVTTMPTPQQESIVDVPTPPVQADGDSGTMETTMPVPQQENIVDALTPPDQAGGDSSTLENITPAAPQRGREDGVDSQHCSPASKPKFLRVDMSTRMKDIVEELKALCAKVSVILNLELLHSNRSIAQVIGAELRAVHLKEQGYAPILPNIDVKARPKTTSYASEPIFCGRDSEIAIIKKIITTAGDHSSGKDQLTVVPIVGLGGMGKTTLARHIYKETERYFDVGIWVCVSTDFSVPRLLKDILESKSLEKLKKEKESELNGTLEENIEKLLTSKRFLLVLDDMWDTVNNDRWENLLAPFKKGQTKGNMVLVTTRSPSVAQIVKVNTTDTDRPIELEGLDKEAFHKFFWSCVFGGDNKAKEEHKELYEIGEEIMEKLKGSPLAAKTVGRILRNNLDQNHWKRVLDSKEWEQQTGDSDIMPALRLSYDFLPFHLQRCFSYCALFPEDYMFTAQQLIHWWIGLGILQPGPQNRSLEDIGLAYLDDLVNHGFIIKNTSEYQVHDGYDYENNTQYSYSIHDLQHDLGLKVASHECLSLNSSNVVPAEIWPSVRHLSIIIDAIDDVCLKKEKEKKDAVDDGENADFISGLSELLLGERYKIDNLQTLMVFGKLDEKFTVFLGDLIKRASGLRVVYLEEMQSPMKFPILRHLRYLRLGCKNGDKIHLPSMLYRFYHLRILDLSRWWGRINSLPKDMSNLTKLSHITIFGSCFEICNVGKLQLLQELESFQVKKETGFELKQLGKLNKLTVLKIGGLEKVNTKEEAAEAKLVEKQWLQELKLDWSRDDVRDHERGMQGLVLEGLQPPRNLQSLHIRFHGSHSCPTWLGSKQDSPKALQLLNLYEVDWELLPSLGHMEMLRDVTLYMPRLKKLGPGSFGRTIKSLTLIGMGALESWVPGDHDHMFPFLEKLTISGCSTLVSGYSLVSHFIQRSLNLRRLITDDFAEVLVEPICSILSSSLTRLILFGSWGDEFTEEQEDALVLLTSLQNLKFEKFRLVRRLPACLHRLRNLKTLEIVSCDYLWLPEDGLPSSLQELKVECIDDALRSDCNDYICNHPEVKLVNIV